MTTYNSNTVTTTRQVSGDTSTSTTINVDITNAQFVENLFVLKTWTQKLAKYVVLILKEQTMEILQTKLSKNILYKFLFLKHFYKFIFLHKPLCERYKNNTLKIFGLYICRSCLFLYTGFFLSLIFCILSVKSVHLNKYFYLWFSGLLLTTAMSYPPVYYKFSRLSKDFIRFYDGIFLASTFVLCFKIHWELGFLSIFAFIFVKNLYNLKRKGDACTGCPRLSEGTTCEGYILQKEALLKIDEEYSDIMTKQLLKKGRTKFYD